MSSIQTIPDKGAKPESMTKTLIDCRENRAVALTTILIHPAELPDGIPMPEVFGPSPVALPR
jgi:hypothetical protein